MREHLKPGYVALNGYVFTSADCDAYNHIQDKINANPGSEYYKEYSLLTFKAITKMA